MNMENLINTRRLVDTFTDLININSPSFQEGLMGDYIEARLKLSGFRVVRRQYDGSFNLIAHGKGTIKNSLPLMLSAHMDTIEPTEGIRYEVKNNIIRTIGNTVLGADDKSAVAQILEAVTALKETDVPHGGIEIVFTSAEEKGLHGAKHLDFKKIKSRHAIVLDSAGKVGKIVVAAPTHITYEMHIIGKPAHAGIEPEKGVSAIKVAAEIITKAPDGRINRETTANIGIINGGGATNVVSKQVAIRGEIRSHDPVMLKRVKNTIFSAAKSIARMRKAKVFIEEQTEYQAFRINEAEPFLRFMDEVLKECCIRPEHTLTGGGSDANILNQHGIVALNLSNGMQKVHSHEEYIHLDDLYKGSLVVLQAIRKMTGFPDRPQR
jgi:tripeptide aminopeptidase